MDKSFDFSNSETDLRELQKIIGGKVIRWHLKPDLSIDLNNKTLLACAVALQTTHGYLLVESDWYADTEDYGLAGQDCKIRFAAVPDFVETSELTHSKTGQKVSGTSSLVDLTDGRGGKVARIEIYEYYESVEDELVRYDGAVAVTTEINETFVLRVNKSIFGSLYYCFYDQAYDEVKSPCVYG